MMCNVIILCANLDPSFVTGQVITYKMAYPGLGKACVKRTSWSKFCFRLLVPKGPQYLLTLQSVSAADIQIIVDKHNELRSNPRTTQTARAMCKVVSIHMVENMFFNLTFP